MASLNNFSLEEDDFLSKINLTQLLNNCNQTTNPSQSPSYSPISCSSSSPIIMSQRSAVHKPTDVQMKILTDLDPENSLAIWKLVETFKEDKLVQEYFTLLTNVQTKPCVPDATVLSSLPVPPFELPTSVQTTILNNFTAYFQCRYSCMNINSAFENKVCLFSPFIHLNYHSLISFRKTISTSAKRQKLILCKRYKPLLLMALLLQLN